LFLRVRWYQQSASFGKPYPETTDMHNLAPASVGYALNSKTVVRGYGVFFQPLSYRAGTRASRWTRRFNTNVILSPAMAVSHRDAVQQGLHWRSIPAAVFDLSFDNGKYPASIASLTGHPPTRSNELTVDASSPKISIHAAWATGDAPDIRHGVAECVEPEPAFDKHQLFDTFQPDRLCSFRLYAGWLTS
jgi:hypothetical protein